MVYSQFSCPILGRYQYILSIFLYNLGLSKSKPQARNCYYCSHPWGDDLATLRYFSRSFQKHDRSFIKENSDLAFVAKCKSCQIVLLPLLLILMRPGANFGPSGFYLFSLTNAALVHSAIAPLLSINN